MRIGFDARMLDHPGIGRYIKNILHAMIEQADGDNFVLYGDSGKLAVFNSFENRDYDVPVYSLREFFSTYFGSEGLDLIHVPHFNISMYKKIKTVITIHDLIYLKFTKFLPVSKIIAAVPLITNAVLKADKIIAVSENTKKDITERWPKTEDKIEVIYEAADPVFRRIDDEEEKERARKKYNLPKDIILFVGSLRAHKNIDRLIEAYKILKAKGISHKLVIVGRDNPKEQKTHAKMKEDEVLYLGEIPQDDLVVIYNIAKAFVMPSLYEGFGLPVLEAFACGIPVAASNVSSMPEVTHDAALSFDPYNIEEMADAVYKILSDEGLRLSLIEKGSKRNSEFSWQIAAEKTLEVYRKI